MCGIAGYSLGETVETVDTDELTRALLLGIEPRGRDATGYACKVDDKVWIHKANWQASDFVGAVDTAGARALIAHTRAATKGSPNREVNNHPIDVAGLIGVHNGVIYNDDELFDMTGAHRYGKVDSEAAFMLLHHSLALGAEEPYEVLPLLEGSAALAWLNPEDEPGVLHLARVNSSPLIVAQTLRGSLLFASTRQAINEAALRCGFRVRYVNTIPEGAYLRVRHGRITDVRRFEVPPRYGKRVNKAAERIALGTTFIDYGDREVADEYDMQAYWGDVIERGL